MFFLCFMLYIFSYLFLLYFHWINPLSKLHIFISLPQWSCFCNIFPHSFLTSHFFLKILLLITVTFQGHLLLYFPLIYILCLFSLQNIWDTPINEHNDESEKLHLLGKANLSLNLVQGRINMVRYTWKKRKIMKQ
jgi:hypothetical protein